MTTMSGPRAQIGSTALSGAVIAVCLSVAMIITASVLSIIRAQHQAHNASDLAAISAASEAMESLDDTHCCAAARAIAQSNGAQLQRCEIVRAASEVAVEVEVTVAMGWKIPGVLEDITSTSYAGNQ